MNYLEAIDRACQEPTLTKALTWIAVWETERAVRQALEWQRTGVSTAANGGGWDTCFESLFEGVIANHKDRICPAGHALLPLSEEEAKVMNALSERFLAMGLPHAG